MADPGCPYILLLDCHTTFLSAVRAEAKGCLRKPTPNVACECNFLRLAAGAVSSSSSCYLNACQKELGEGHSG